ncbi:protein 4.1b isoform 1-T2 [Clarias gariepinus]
MTTFQCQVRLLDDTVIERDLEKKAIGQVLFDNVCEYLNLLEKDYFGLAAWDSSNSKVWLDLSKKVHKQIIGQVATFSFCVKFYPPDPSVLAEDITRYLLCLQLRADILTSRLACPSDMLAVLGSYTIQSEFGDYNPELHGKEFFSRIPLGPNQTSELEEKVAELHRTLNSMSPAEADQLFLQNAKTLDMYGVHLHPAKDASGGAVMLGVCANGLMVYEDETKTQSFIWPSVLNMSYRRNNFQANIFHSEDASVSTLKFSLSSYRACKRLWRNAAEHHGFFRNHRSPDKARRGRLHLGSRFCFQGPTHAESLEASSTIERPAPDFARSAIKRKASDSDSLALKRLNQPEFDELLEELGSDESWSRVQEIREEQTGGETLVYKERQETDKPDNESSQQLGGRSFQTQQSFSYLSSGTGVSESTKFKLWKLEADDWFVLLAPHPYQPLKDLSLSLQSSQAEAQGEELKWIEKSSEKSIKIIKIRKENGAMTEYSEELELGPDFAGENLELDVGGSEQMMKVMRKKIELEGDGEELKTVVMYERRMQEGETSGQSQNHIFEPRIREMEVGETVHELMLKSGQVMPEETIEELEERLQEVEDIGQRLRQIERIKGRLQAVEFLEQKLQEVQQQGESDDWYILLEHKLMESSAPAKRLGVDTSEQELEDIELKRREQGEEGDWHLVRDDETLVISSASAGHIMDTGEQKAEIIQEWREEERADTVRPVQMNDDWYLLLELLPQATQTMQTAEPPSASVVDRQSSWDHVKEEHVTLSEETAWTDEKAIYVREAQPDLPAQKEKQVDDDWFIQLDFSPKDTVIDSQSSLAHVEEEHVTVSEETKWTEERTIHVREAQPDLPAQREKQVDDDWFVKLSVSPKDTVIDSQLSRAHVEEEAINLNEETKWTEKRTIHLREGQATLPARREKQVDDDWFVQMTVSPEDTDVRQETRDEDIQLFKKEVNVIQFKEERGEVIETSHEVEEIHLLPFEKRADISAQESAIVALKHTTRTEADDWFQLFGFDESRPTYKPVTTTLDSEDAAGLRYQQTVMIKGREVTFDHKPMIIKEKQVIVGGIEKKMAALVHKDEDDWFILFAPALIKKKVITTAETYQMEVIDDWSHLLAPVSKKIVTVHVRAEEDQRRKEELLKKQIITEDRIKVPVIKPSVPVIPLTPADQPMTSTPTAQSIHITRPAYKEDRLKRLDITQEITQDITEDEFKRRDKRDKRESIYVRHSNLMLEDSDITQEVVLKHHESVSLLKRIFMEDVPVYGPTEWDRRLSSYTPIVYPKISNGDLFSGLELMAADGILVM